MIRLSTIMGFLKIKRPESLALWLKAWLLSVTLPSSPEMLSSPSSDPAPFYSLCTCPWVFSAHSTDTGSWHFSRVWLLASLTGIQSILVLTWLPDKQHVTCFTPCTFPKRTAVCLVPSSPMYIWYSLCNVTSWIWNQLHGAISKETFCGTCFWEKSLR